MKKIIIVLFLYTAQNLSGAEIYLKIFEPSYTYKKSELGESLIIVEKENFNTQTPNNISEVVNNLSGVNISESGYGGNASIYINGQKSEYTSVFLDGIEINDPITPANSSDISIINPISLEQIKILSNPLSGSYGSNAMGGIINFITLPREQGVFLDLNYDSLGLVNSNIVFSQKKDKVSYFISSSRLDNFGTSKSKNPDSSNLEKDHSLNNSIAIGFDLKIDEKTNIETYYRNITSEDELDSGAYSDDPNYNSRTYYNLGKINLKKQISEKYNTSLIANYFYSKRDYQNLPDNLSSSLEDSWYRGKRLVLRNTNEFYPTSNILLNADIEYRKETGDSYYYYSDGLWGPYTSIFDEKIQEEKSLSLKNSFFIKNLTFSIAYRIADRSSFGDYSSYNSYLSFEFLKKIILKTSFGTSTKTPSLYQLYSSYGNKNLSPDKTSSFSLGSSFKPYGNIFDIDLEYFRNISNNLIDFDMSNWKYVNIGKVRTEGINSAIRIEKSSLKMSFNYSRLSAWNIQEKNTLLRRPKDNFSFEGYYKATNKLNLGLASFLRGSRYDIDENYLRIKMKSYIKTDLFADYNLNPDFTIKAGIKNAFNANYEDIYGYFYPRRSFFIALSTKF